MNSTDFFQVAFKADFDVFETRPEKYYIYKFDEVKTVARELEADYDIRKR